jgi:shikimate dehydrogenase
MIKAAVLGSPISHSLSPKIHSKAYEILGLDASYEAIEVTEESLHDFFESLGSDLGRSNWSGFSLTMPLKEIVLKEFRSGDRIAGRINSANTLYRLEDSWKATSTDYLAFQNLIEGCKISNDSKIAIIGGGGTARAAIGALNSKVKTVDVLLRSTERLPGLIKAAPDLAINSLAMSSALDGYDLIIQTTPAGVFDEYVGATTRASGILLEALYIPWPTRLVAHYEQLGGRIISGKQLLVEQALYQIELFSGKSFDFNIMRSELLSVVSLD